MTSFWKELIPRWFQPFDRYPDQEPKATQAVGRTTYFAGRKTSGTTGTSELRTIIVYAVGFDTYHFEHPHIERGAIALGATDPLKRFWGKVLAIDEDCLVLMDETFAPTLIPWDRIRYIEVD
jgi:hypothetical protein